MNRSLIVLLAVTSIAACSPGPVATTAAPAQAAVPAAAPGTITGTIAETMNSGGYTYARVQATPKDVWIASTELPIKIGDRMTAAIDMPIPVPQINTPRLILPLSISRAKASAKSG